MMDDLLGSLFGPIFGNNQRTDVTTVKTVHEIVQRDDAEILHLRAENERLRAENEKLLRRSKIWFKIAQDLGHQDTFLPDMGDSDG